MEADFAYLNRIHTKVKINKKDLQITQSLFYELELYQNLIYTYCLNSQIHTITDPKIQQKIIDHKEYLKLKYELVFDW